MLGVFSVYCWTHERRATVNNQNAIIILRSIANNVIKSSRTHKTVENICVEESLVGNFEFHVVCAR